MEKGAMNLVLSVALLLTVSVSQSFPRARKPNFYSNPLLLDGKSMNITNVSPGSRGKMSMLGSAEESETRSQIPFFVYLKRNGQILNRETSPSRQAVMEIELSSLLKSARAGDELVIDPVLKCEASSRRVITIKQEQPFREIRWFNYGVNKSLGGC